MNVVVELILRPSQVQAIDELERVWQERESARRWDDSNETCERLLAWLRGQGRASG